MTMDDKSRATKSPARPKTASQGQPAMTQKSLFSFFKPTAPAKVPESQSPTDLLPSASLKTPTIRNGQGIGYSNGVDGHAFSDHRSTSVLFSTDETVLPPSTPPSKSAPKRKTMDFDEEEVLSSMKAQHETPNVKRFAAEVEKLTLNTPVKQPRLDIPDEDDLEEALGSRRSSRGVRRIRYQISDEEEDDDIEGPPKTPTKARRKASRQRDDDDDNDSEYEAPTAAIEDEDFDMDIDLTELEAAELDAAFDDVDDEPAPSPPRKKAPAPKPPAAPTKPMTGIFNKGAAPQVSPRSTLKLKDDKKKERIAKFEETNKGRYAWLLDIKDADKNPIGSPDYDPRTLYIPQSAWKEFSEFESQFWEIKGKHFDSVVFFKKGKFYELYENDADIGHQQFDLKLTDRTNMRMVGVPEASFDHWAAQFIAKGYKVARVDQMETALGKAMRERGKTQAKAAPKVIRRELHSILTAGTLTDSGLLTNEMATYCMAVKELSRPGAEHLPTQFGIAFVDTSTAEFSLATFYDDMDRTKFETLITQIKPREVVVEKGGLSVRSTRILKNTLGVNAIWNHLQPETQFWDAMTTRDEIRIREYFGKNVPGATDSECWPAALEKMEGNLAVLSAFGGLIWYLRSLKLDEELLSFKNFQVYDPVKQASTLILDGQTLTNLEIFQNNSDGTEAGTVLRLLNRCVTPFGKRLFRRWLCHPLRSTTAIAARLDAVEDLMRVPGFLELFEEKCARFPDLERIVSRIHAGSCKIADFLVVLSTFKTLMDTARRLSSYTEQFQSKKIASVLEELPDLTNYLEYFDGAFDHRIASAGGEIVPYPGFAEDFDEIDETLKRLDSEFAAYLDRAKSILKTTKIVYKDLGKEIYQLEVSNKVSVPKDWTMKSSTSSVKRYYTPKLVEIITELQEARETKNSIMKELQSRLYAKFDENYKDWLKAVKIIAEIDCLGSLSKSSSALGSPACRPEFVESEQSVLELEGLRHPCVIPGIATDFIPNDTVLGGESPNLILLTGPNMGGKSTLLRQTCVAIIMAQLGCYVPAEKCRLTPFDRIFTRIGANDNILAGQSTFMVELSETSKILAEATERSMVILDELGRGTSTFDGYAIAYSVLHELSTRIGCLGLFSTHYGTLTTEFERDPNVALKHMACQVDQVNREVTFLYKLIEGVCEKSYGMNVAHMAGVPRAIVERAEEMAQAFELKQESKRKQEMELKKGAKDIGQMVIMDLAFLLSRVDKEREKTRAAEVMELEEEEAQGVEDAMVVPRKHGSHRVFSQEQEVRTLNRILKSLGNL
ncbi:DNA mismatch repair protein msh6 [Podila epicladia]|nr:DNA mismatch repair protein msh6 [Podila epicladia]KAG0098133.1 DNA mismatch repair protein msh6 [Podila epicladia]